MKSKFLFLGILISGLMLFSDYSVNGQVPQKKTDAMQTLKYTCPMHPQVIQDEPGKCSMCGMKLSVKKDLLNGTMQHMNDSLRMKHDHMSLMHDSTSMKKREMMRDTNLMDNKSMMNNTKIQMRNDTTSMKLNRMKKK